MDNHIGSYVDAATLMQLKIGFGSGSRKRQSIWNQKWNYAGRLRQMPLPKTEGVGMHPQRSTRQTHGTREASLSEQTD